MQDDNHEGKIDQTANRKLGEDRKLAVRWQRKEKEGIVQFTSIHAEPTLACRGRAVTSDKGDFRWARDLTVAVPHKIRQEGPTLDQCHIRPLVLANATPRELLASGVKKR